MEPITFLKALFALRFPTNCADKLQALSKINLTNQKTHRQREICISKISFQVMELLLTLQQFCLKNSGKLINM